MQSKALSEVWYCLTPGSFHTNPQYHVTLRDVDDDADDGMCTVVVALMQKHRRLLKKHGGANMTIGYEIYQVWKNSVPLFPDTQNSNAQWRKHIFLLGNCRQKQRTVETWTKSFSLDTDPPRLQTSTSTQEKTVGGTNSRQETTPLFPPHSNPTKRPILFYEFTRKKRAAWCEYADCFKAFLAYWLFGKTPFEGNTKVGDFSWCLAMTHFLSIPVSGQKCFLCTARPFLYTAQREPEIKGFFLLVFRTGYSNMTYFLAISVRPTRTRELYRQPTWRWWRVLQPGRPLNKLSESSRQGQAPKNS